MKDRIILSADHKKLLVEEFDTSHTSVRLSLNYAFNSKQAIKIRERAKQLLLEEAGKING